MANHKSAAKRHLQSEKTRVRNRAVKSSLHTQMKKAHAEITSKTAKVNEGEIRSAQSLIATAAAKGVMHKKTASRRISRLMSKAAKVA
jgi:small subunit ribosomal protein S20